MLQTLDCQLFTLINGAHTPFWDGVMVFVSRRESWIPAYILLTGWLIWHFRRRAWLLLPLAFAAVGAADSVSSRFFKPWLGRLRPCHEPALARTLHLVTEVGCGGTYGFVSSHAANTAALATLLSLVLPARFRTFKGGLIAWAALTGYSRIYLGAHYPGDVLAGWALGAALGAGAAWLYERGVRQWAL